MERRMDNRLGERVLIQRTIWLISTRPRTASTGRIMNLSRSGACVVDCDLQLFSLIHVHFEPEPHDRVKRPEDTISGYVTRVSGQSAGIEWCEFAPPLVVELLQTELMSLEASVQRRFEDCTEMASEAAGVTRSAAAA